MSGDGAGPPPTSDRYDDVPGVAFNFVLDRFLVEDVVAAAELAVAERERDVGSAGQQRGAVQPSVKRVKRSTTGVEVDVQGVMYAKTLEALRRLGDTCCRLHCCARVLNTNLAAVKQLADGLEFLPPVHRRMMFSLFYSRTPLVSDSSPTEFFPFGIVCARAVDALLLQAKTSNAVYQLRQRRLPDSPFPPLHGLIDRLANNSAIRTGQWLVGRTLLGLLKGYVSETLPLSVARCSRVGLRDGDEVYLLPSSLTTRVVHALYLHFCQRLANCPDDLAIQLPASVVQAAHLEPLAYSTFMDHWHHDSATRLLRTRDGDKMKCDKCCTFDLQMSTAANSLAHLQDDDEAREAAGNQLAALVTQRRAHLQEAMDRRRQYQADVMFSVARFAGAPTLSLRAESPALADPIVHLTFDYAATITIPRVPSPPNSWYYLVKYDARWFGVRRDERRECYHYVYRPDAGAAGSANVMSLLLLHFRQQPLPPGCTIIIHADNCSGQNKSWAMMCFLSALTISGLTNRIIVRFMVPGHTHNRVDGAFGIVRQAYVRTEVYSFSCLVRMINAIKNQHATLVGPAVHRDWPKAFTELFKSGKVLSQTVARLAGHGSNSMRTAREIEFTAAAPGDATLRWPTRGDITISLLNPTASLSDVARLVREFDNDTVVPQLGRPPGLSAKAVRDLKELIETTIPPEFKDEMSPSLYDQSTSPAQPPSRASDNDGVPQADDDGLGDVGDAQALSHAEVLLRAGPNAAVAAALLCPLCLKDCVDHFRACDGPCQRLFHLACLPRDASSLFGASGFAGCALFLCTDCENEG